MVGIVPRSVFVSVIDRVHAQFLKDRANRDYLVEVFGGDVGLYDNSLLVQCVVDLLRVWFPQDGDYCELEHWIFERDFGSVWKDDGEGGFEVFRESSGELWDRLVGEKKSLRDE